MKIEAGKFYRTRDGRKIGPMEKSGSIDYPFTSPASCLTYSPEGRFNIHHKKDSLNLIEEWTDPIVSRAEPDNPHYGEGVGFATRKDFVESCIAEPDAPKTVRRIDGKPLTWGEMLDEHKGALLLGAFNGEEIEAIDPNDPSDNWETAGPYAKSRYQFVSMLAYRIKPSPVRETVTVTCSWSAFTVGLVAAGNWKFELPAIDHRIIPGTYTNEAGDVITMTEIGDD